MKIGSITIRGFRSLKDVTIDVDDYGVLIGANGSGKSSVLYALDWFFGNRALTDSDISGYADDTALPEGSSAEVGVAFVDLTAKDRERLQQYGRGTKAVLRRSWVHTSGQSATKYVGNAKQGEGFAEVRALTRAPDYRPAYAALLAKFDDLPDLGGSATKDEISGALTAWENNPAHELALVDVADDDATHMFGINGGNVLRDCVRMVLVPAAINMASHIGETSSKNSALTELIGAVMADASSKAKSAWLAKHESVLSELAVSVRESIEASTSVQASRINSRLQSLVPNATVALTPTVPDWTPKTEPAVATSVTIDGITNDVSRQGHGMQRAVMIAMLQALVPDGTLATSAHSAAEGEDEVAAKERLEKEIEGLPALVVAIEEPEIYQHPARARSFARTLTTLAGQPNVQVIVATHSPFFVRPEQFESLQRFTLEEGTTKTARATVATIAAKTGIPVNKLRSAIERTVPTEFSEGYFADKVALVEGATDRIVLEVVASRLGKDLDARGISVLSVSGKESLHTAHEILASLKIPVYVLVDGDFNLAQKKYPTDLAKQTEAHASHRRSTEAVIAWLPTSTALVGNSPNTFGSSTIAANYTVWADDIEEELLAWPSLVSAAAVRGFSLADRSEKVAMLYKEVLLEADAADMPSNLQTLVQAILEL